MFTALFIIALFIRKINYSLAPLEIIVLAPPSAAQQKGFEIIKGHEKSLIACFREPRE